MAVTVAIALMARTRIHLFIRDVLSEEELTDALIFAAAALVILPLVPIDMLVRSALLILVQSGRS